MNKTDIDRIDTIRKLLKKQKRYLRRISTLYDIAIWARHMIMKYELKVEDVQNRITNAIELLEDEKIKKEFEIETSKDESKQSA